MKVVDRMKIEFAKQEDLESIIAIEKICFVEAEAASKEDLKKRFETFGDNFLVARDHQKVIGFINGGTSDTLVLEDAFYHDTSLHTPSGAYQTVFGLDVLPEYRNQGVAFMLMEAFIDLAKKRGKKGMILTCKDSLIHYYEKFGYVCQGVSGSTHGGAKWNDMILLFDQ